MVKIECGNCGLSSLIEISLSRREKEQLGERSIPTLMCPYCVHITLDAQHADPTSAEVISLQAANTQVQSIVALGDGAVISNVTMVRKG